MEARTPHQVTQESGQGLVEYGLILVLIMVVASVALGALGKEFQITGYFGTHMSELAATLGT